MAQKAIKRIIPSEKVNMGGIPIEQPLPWKDIQQVDPFLLIHHWKQTYPGGQDPSRIGVGPHPHRGFAPVTFIYSGDIHHRDSKGNDAIVGAGGTQWMFAGSGLVHSERPSAHLAREGGTLELIQFWVNVPGEYKMQPATYHPLQKEDTPTLDSADGQISLAIASGELQDVRGPIATFRPLLTAQLFFRESGRMSFELPANQNTLLYVMDGALRVNGQEASAKNLVWFEKGSGEKIELETIKSGKGMLLSAEPIGEPVATYGPFVMNTSREIMQALEDAQSGKMGSLTENFQDA